MGEAVFVLIPNAGLLRGPRFMLVTSLSLGVCRVTRVTGGQVYNWRKLKGAFAEI